MVRQGPELFTLQYAEDGLNFEVKSHLMHVPHAGNFFREGHFRDIDEYPAERPTWGLAHDYRFGSQEAHIIRFDLSFTAKQD